MRQLVRVTLAAVLGITALAPAAHAASRPEVIATSNRLFMVSDSVGLGAVNAMKSAFGSSWQVTVSGKPGLFTEQLVSYVKSAPASAFGESAIVATGYNYPYWDPPRFDKSVDLMVSALKARGVTRIYWVTIREVKPAFYSKWNGLGAAYKTLYNAYPRTNSQLRAALARHPQLSIIDWAASSDRNGLTYDAIHLNPTGAALYSGLAKSTVLSGRTRVAAGTVTQVQVAGARTVPIDAAAVSVNVTVVNPRKEGYVSVYPCDAVGVARPVNVWYRPAQTVANAAVVPLGASGKVCVYQRESAHVLVDMNGWFPAGSGALPLLPRLVVDNRPSASIPAGAVTKVRLAAITGAPAPPFVAAVTLTTFASAAGDTRVYTCGTTPGRAPARSLEAGVAQSVHQVVRTDRNGDVCVATTSASKFALSMLAAFDTTADVHPVANRRVLDTRATGGALAAGVARAMTVPEGTSGWMSLTLVGPAANGSATLYPCAGGAPTVQFVHVVANHAQTNAGVVDIDGTHRVCVRSSVATHALVDLSGWSGTAFTPMAPVRILATLR